MPMKAEGQRATTVRDKLSKGLWQAPAKERLFVPGAWSQAGLSGEQMLPRRKALSLVETTLAPAHDGISRRRPFLSLL